MREEEKITRNKSYFTFSCISFLLCLLIINNNTKHTPASLHTAPAAPHPPSSGRSPLSQFPLFSYFLFLFGHEGNDNSNNYEISQTIYPRAFLLLCRPMYELYNYDVQNGFLNLSLNIFNTIDNRRRRVFTDTKIYWMVFIFFFVEISVSFLSFKFPWHVQGSRNLS